MLRRRWARILGLLIGMALVFGAGWFVEYLHAGRGPRATHFVGEPELGALFDSNAIVRSLHSCSASVVDSEAGDLIVTAAHCIKSDPRSYAFVPMFHDGTAPFGRWAVEKEYVDPRWTLHRDPHADYAFLVVKRQGASGPQGSLQSLVGANRLVAASGFGNLIVAMGYPAGFGGRPVMCAAITYDHDGYPGFHCAGFAPGTSGGPWLALRGPAPRSTSIVGVTGGFQEGGATSSTSYSTYFDDSTVALYQRARAGL